MKSSIPGLAALAGGIGDPHVRQRGTIGGSVANNDPSADYPAALMALGATIGTNRREIKADAFFTGLFSTALQDGEIITRISFPAARQVRLRQVPQPGLALCPGRRRRGADGRGGTRRRHRRAAATACSATLPWRRRSARTGRPRPLNGIATDAKDMVSDIHADAAYRAHLVGVMARRAVAAA